jgi:hypothetical protein
LPSFKRPAHAATFHGGASVGASTSPSEASARTGGLAHRDLAASREVFPMDNLRITEFFLAIVSQISAVKTLSQTIPVRLLAALILLYTILVT